MGAHVAAKFCVFGHTPWARFRLQEVMFTRHKCNWTSGCDHFWSACKKLLQIAWSRSCELESNHFIDSRYLSMVSSCCPSISNQVQLHVWMMRENVLHRYKASSPVEDNLNNANNRLFTDTFLISNSDSEVSTMSPHMWGNLSCWCVTMEVNRIDCASYFSFPVTCM